MILTGVLVMLVGSSAGAQEKCSKLADKFLTGMNYGTFERPHSGVSKQRKKDGSYLFQVPGGPSFSFSNGKMVSSQYLMGMNAVTTFEFDRNCEITSVSGASTSPSGSTFSKADPAECSKLRMRASGPTPTLSISEQVSLMWCGQYFSNTGSSSKGTDNGNIEPGVQ